MATHYEVLGVDPDASFAAIRRAYRDRARQFHPDHAGDAGEMSVVNEAYRVLGEPGRRAVYDRSLHDAGSTTTVADDVDDEYESRPPPRHTSLSPDGPARFPWKLTLLAGLFGSGVVLVAAAVTDPPSEEPPDGIIRVGSCVTIEPNGDAREIACTGDGDVVVELFLPTDAECPVGLEPHRDRLGLGIACIEPA